MLLLLLLQYCVLLVNSSKNTTSNSFRVANGLAAYYKNYQHLVRVFTVRRSLDKEQNVRFHDNGEQIISIDKCTGMKVTREQLKGVANREGSGMAEFVLTAGHCIRPKVKVNLAPNPETGEIEIKDYSELLFVFVASGHTKIPTPKHLSGSTFQFVKALRDDVQSIIWTSSYYPFESERGLLKRRDQNDRSEEILDTTDIALLKLETPLETPVINLEFTDPPGGIPQSCQLAGWGVNQRGKDTGYLRKVKSKATEMLSRDDCRQHKLSLIDRLRLTSAQLEEDSREFTPEQLALLSDVADIGNKPTLCSMHRSGSIGCHGDSGAPLLCEKNGEKVAYGVMMQGRSSIRKTLVFANRSSLFVPRIVSKPVDCSKQGFRGATQMATYSRLSYQRAKEYLGRCADILAKSDGELNEQKSDEAIGAFMERPGDRCGLVSLTFNEAVFDFNQGISLSGWTVGVMYLAIFVYAWI